MRYPYISEEPAQFSIFSTIFHFYKCQYISSYISSAGDCLLQLAFHLEHWANISAKPLKIPHVSMYYKQIFHNNFMNMSGFREYACKSSCSFHN